MSRTLILFRQDVLVIIAAFGVGHHGQLEVGRVVADDAAEVVLDAVFPAAVFALLDAFARRLVAQFHVIHAGGHAGVVNHLDDFVVEMVVVHQAAVADGAIEDLDFGPVGKPAAGGGVFGFGSFHGCQLVGDMPNLHFALNLAGMDSGNWPYFDTLFALRRSKKRPPTCERNPG